MPTTAGTDINKTQKPVTPNIHDSYMGGRDPSTGAKHCYFLGYIVTGSWIRSRVKTQSQALPYSVCMSHVVV